MSEAQKFKKLLVVIPTRNRADLVTNAINSVLAQDNRNFEVLVSDNSTDEREVQKLSAFCEQLADNRLRYIRPPHSMSMTKHWDWAMQQALELSDFSHVSYLSDRMIFIKNSLNILQNIATDYPDKVISYAYDSIIDSKQPISLLQRKWTGKLFEIDSFHILDVYADKIDGALALPRMLNSITPREVLKMSFEMYGTYFSSNAPDYNFGFRCLELFDTVLYYDKPLLIDYGIFRSNGINLLKGNLQQEAADFMKNLKSNEVCFDTPVKFYAVVPNVIAHEYHFIKQATENTKFPEMTKESYLQTLVYHIFAFENAEIRRELLKKLYPALGFNVYRYYLQTRIKYKFRGLKVKLHNLFNSTDPYLVINNFQSVEEAFDHANNSPRPPSANYKLIEDRIGSLSSEQDQMKILGNYK